MNEQSLSQTFYILLLWWNLWFDHIPFSFVGCPGQALPFWVLATNQSRREVRQQKGPDLDTCQTNSRLAKGMTPCDIVDAQFSTQLPVLCHVCYDFVAAILHRFATIRTMGFVGASRFGASLCVVKFWRSCVHIYMNQGDHVHVWTLAWNIEYCVCHILVL